MSLENKIKGYFNFSKQTNFDSSAQPESSSSAAAKSGYHGKIEKTDAELYREAQAKKEAEKAKEVAVAEEKKEAPKAEAPVENKAELEAFDKQRAAAAEKQGKEIAATLAGGTGDATATKAVATEDQNIEVPNQVVKANSNPDDKYNKFVEKYGDLKADPTESPADKFLAEKGTTKAKATQVATKTPWDKNDEATGDSWKNGAGQTIKSYRDKDGNIYIRGREGKVVLFDAQGNPSKAATGKYRTMAKAFKGATAGKAPVADIREKNPDGTTTAAKPTGGEKIQTAMKGEDYQKQYEATQKALLEPDKRKLVR